MNHNISYVKRRKQQYYHNKMIFSCSIHVLKLSRHDHDASGHIIYSRILNSKVEIRQYSELPYLMSYTRARQPKIFKNRIGTDWLSKHLTNVHVVLCICVAVVHRHISKMTKIWESCFSSKFFEPTHTPNNSYHESTKNTPSIATRLDSRRW